MGDVWNLFKDLECHRSLPGHHLWIIIRMDVQRARVLSELATLLIYKRE